MSILGFWKKAIKKLMDAHVGVQPRENRTYNTLFITIPYLDWCRGMVKQKGFIDVYERLGDSFINFSCPNLSITWPICNLNGVVKHIQLNKEGKETHKTWKDKELCNRDYADFCF